MCACDRDREKKELSDYGWKWEIMKIHIYIFINFIRISYKMRNYENSYDSLNHFHKNTRIVCAQWQEAITLNSFKLII